MKPRSTWIGIALLLPLGCTPDDQAPSDEGSATDTGTADAGDDGASTCVPGEQIECACTDGSTGAQACNADGSGYGACACAGGTAGDTQDSGAPVGTDEDSGGLTSDSGETSSVESSGGDSTTGAPGCVAGEVVACDAAMGPGYAECVAETGEFGACNGCAGEHPLVRGDLRYCEEGWCYCGNLRVDPPVDACYAEAIADVCCEYELECY